MPKYVVYDVFTDTPFGGNQLAVFPDATDIPESLLQKITAEFNFSEVTFVYPPRESTHAARVRIFTPTTEVDFAGHPTIGTAKALYDLGYGDDLVLELGVGPIYCLVTETGASFTATQTLDIISYIPTSLVARALRLSETSIVASTHAPVQASLGLPFVIVELNDEESLSSCDPHIETIREGAKRYPAGLDFAIFAYVRDGESIRARMFAPLDNIPEDPATGSASATLAALLTQKLKCPLTINLSQGVEMGRPSFIKLETTQNPLSAKVSGQAVKVMEGQFILPPSQ